MSFILLSVLTAKCQVVQMPVGGKDRPQALDIPFNPALGQGFSCAAISVSAILPYGLSQIQNNQAILALPVAGNVISAGMHRVHFDKWTAQKIMFSVSRTINPGFDMGLQAVYEYAGAENEKSRQNISGGGGFVFRLNGQVYTSVSFRNLPANSPKQGVLYHASLTYNLSRQVRIAGWMENMSEQQTSLSLGLNYCLAKNLDVQCVVEPALYKWNFSAIILSAKINTTVGIQKNEIPGLSSYAVVQFHVKNSGKP